jgi:hypothetical protein
MPCNNHTPFAGRKPIATQQIKIGKAIQKKNQSDLTKK